MGGFKKLSYISFFHIHMQEEYVFDPSRDKSMGFSMFCVYQVHFFQELKTLFWKHFNMRVSHEAPLNANAMPIYTEYRNGIL